MTSNGLKTTAYGSIPKDFAASGVFRVVIEVLTGADNSVTKIPDIKKEVFFLGMRVLNHKFVL